MKGIKNHDTDVYIALSSRILLLVSFAACVRREAKICHDHIQKHLIEFEMVIVR